MQYSISEFSKITGIGLHTLRYYEKEQLIIPARNNSGRRFYTDNDIKWIEFIKRLKETKMPIKEIQQYALLRAKGESTLEARMEMLIQHRLLLLGEIAAMQKHLLKLNEKIEYYKINIGQ